MTCSKGCGCGDNKTKTYGSLKYCDSHKKYDVCGYKSTNHGNSCPPKGHGEKNACGCDCDKKEECCDEKFVFDCEDLAKIHTCKTVTSTLAEGCSEVTIGVSVTPKVEHCKVVGFNFTVNETCDITSEDYEAKSVTVKTCKDVFCLTKCELEKQEFHLPSDCGCKQTHEIKGIEFCIVKDTGKRH